MSFLRVRAVSLLMAAILWIVPTLLACGPDSEWNARSSCCATMRMQDCGSEQMLGGTCCAHAPTNSAPAEISAYSPEHAQPVAILLRDEVPPLTVYSEMGQRQFHEESPPDPWANGLSVLRI